MTIHKTPEKLNGTQLREELQKAGVKISEEPGSVIVINDNLILEVLDADESKADKVVNSHVGIDRENPNLMAKNELLQRLGLTPEELATLLA